jgi:CRP/FNR family transcriptional regulator, cyclic AMP receptor protein
MTIKKDVYSKHVMNVEAGKIIFSEGDDAKGVMFIIISGEVEIAKRTSVETSKTLIILKKGDIFGEMGIIERKPRSATAIALSATKLLSLDQGLFFNMIEHNSDFAVKVVKILSERLRRTNSLIQSLVSSSREAIVQAGAKEYAKTHGLDSVKGRRVNRDKFLAWATNHIGLPEKEIQEGLSHLINRSLLARGAAPGEFVIPLGK